MKKYSSGSEIGLPGPVDWIPTAAELVSANKSAVLVMITKDAGSTPRDSGTWMLVTHESILGTLGGGRLEKLAENAAKRLLDQSDNKRRSTMRCLLGPDAQQCCGGAIRLLLELLDTHSIAWLNKAMASKNNSDNLVLFPIVDNQMPPSIISEKESLLLTENVHLQPLRETRPLLCLFGAGHVGRSLCVIASQLPLRIMVLDQRPSMLALIPHSSNVSVTNMGEPEPCAQNIPAHSSALVMTHDHSLDYKICCALLRHRALTFIGLIGSQSKAARFRSRLRDDGFPKKSIDRLISPIGALGPVGKEPGVIALSALTEILTILDNSDTATAPHFTPLTKSVAN